MPSRAARRLLLTGLGGGAGVPPVSLTGFISYYKLEEASGNRADSIGSNTLAPSNAPGNAAAKLGNGALFVLASSQRLSIASNASLETGDIDFTIGCWFRPTAATTNALIFGKTNGAGAASYEYALFMNSSRVLSLIVGNNTTLQVLSWATPLTLDSWYYLIGWHVGGGTPTLNLSVNNAATQSAVRTVTPLAEAAKPLNIGGNGGGADFVDGIVDEGFFAKRILTADERTALYNGGAGYNGFLP